MVVRIAGGNLRQRRLSREARRVVRLKDWSGATRSHPLKNAVALASLARTVRPGDGERWRLRPSIRDTKSLRSAALASNAEDPRGDQAPLPKTNPPMPGVEPVRARCSCSLQPAPLFNVLTTDYRWPAVLFG
jgi:hypothetical protein